ncbi:MAG TPA: 4-alpha-glucanotransferase [Gemmatimonadaceae bacterium]|nr:4-alpha-glucanotransferase [Gemmatimonadaceae bacterium]
MSSHLERLAGYLGVLPSYVDFGGRTKATSPDTMRGILRAMGYVVDDEAMARDRLASLQDEELRQPLDPVVIHRHGVQNRLVVRAPRRDGAVRWKVTIRSERGRIAARDGMFDTAGPLEVDTPAFGAGYYDVRFTLTTRRRETEATQSLIVVPERCVVPSDILGDRKAFGVFANLYSIRGDRNWGVGDVGDLETLSRWVGSAGGSFVGLNPLHALLNRGGDISPYGPVTRLWRNPIYIEVDRVPEFRSVPGMAERVRSAEIDSALADLRESPRVEYSQAWAMKSLALDVLHQAFLELQSTHATHPRVAEYNTFVARGGRWLEDYATWMAIAESRGEWNWRTWPADLQTRESVTVRRFAVEHSRRIEFHKWTQFELDRQLEDVAATCRGSMEIGLYQDLAVGSSGTGSDAWSQREMFRDGATIGAPPDPYSDFGQNWGLPPIDPRALQRDRYRYFIQLLRSGFRHAGALRMDHVMGLFRLFWIPEGASGREGAYVRYPADDLLGILALESQRHSAIVVGEDLGVVPPEVPPAMEKWGILSSKVLYFEREDGGGFKPQSAYPALSLASVNTHDMPTIAGFWSGRDIELRKSLGLIDEGGSARSVADRDNEKRRLLDRLREDAALPLHDHPPMDAAGVPTVKRAVHDLLCASPAALFAYSLDDLGDEVEPINVPGVGTDKYPCWSRKMRKTIPEIAATATEDLAGCTTRARQS